MATYKWYVYPNNSWMEIEGNTLVFSGDPDLITEPIALEDINMGTHLGDGDPGNDVCGATGHVKNVAYVRDTQYLKGTDETVYVFASDILSAIDCTLRINVSSRWSITVTAGTFYAFDGNTEYNTAAAVGVHCWAYQAVVSNTQWSLINDQSNAIGGIGDGMAITFTDTQGTDFNLYFALSVSPESLGQKTQFDLGIALTYS